MPAEVTADEQREYIVTWLRTFGAALAKGERKETRLLEDGRVQMLFEFPSFDSAFFVAQQIDTLKAMASGQRAPGLN